VKLKVNRPYRLVLAVLIFGTVVIYFIEETSFTSMLLISGFLSLGVLLYESLRKKKK